MSEALTLEGVLGAHRYHHAASTGLARCACGFIGPYTIDAKIGINAHLADAVRAWLLGQREVVARMMALLEDGEDWPSNEALGGSMTGTRDDEYRGAMFDQADEVLALIGGAR